jgi:two-component system sensor histidine kinase QseC
VGNGIDFDYRPGSAPDFGRDFRFELTLSDGSLLERSDGLNQEPLQLPAGTVGESVICPLRLPDGHWVRGCSVTFEPKVVDPSEHVEPVDRPNAPTGPVRLVIAASTREVDRLLATLLGIETLVAALLVSGTVYSLRRSVRLGLAPVEVLAAQVTSIDPDRLTTRVDAMAQPRELRPIADRINQLLGRLEEAFAREKRFAANAAHELRTPIAEVRVLAEVASESPLDSDKQRGFAEIVKVSHEMQMMIANLLAMARSRSGNLQVDSRRTELGALVTDLCAKQRSLWANAGKQLLFAGGVRAWAKTDPVLLGAIVNNLLENAATYSVPGEPVSVTLEQRGSEIVLGVENACEGVTQEDIENFFEPFWRKSGTAVAGNRSGLGLALVRSLCETLRVRVSATLVTPARVRVECVIPADSERSAMDLCDGIDAAVAPDTLATSR